MRKDLKTGFFVGMVVAAAVMVAISIYSTTVEQRLSQQPIAAPEPEQPGGDNSPVFGKPAGQEGPVVPPPTDRGAGEEIGAAGVVDEGVDIAELMETALSVEAVESQYQPVEPEPAAPPAKVVPKRRQMYHVVVDSETLSSIAHLHYGDGEKWPKIYNANRDIIKNTNFLKPGMRLRLPE